GTTATDTSPDTVVASASPAAMLSTRTSPLAVLAVTDCPAWPTCTSPLAVVPRTWPNWPSRVTSAEAAETMAEEPSGTSTSRSSEALPRIDDRFGTCTRSVSFLKPPSVSASSCSRAWPEARSETVTVVVGRAVTLIVPAGSSMSTAIGPAAANSHEAMIFLLLAGARQACLSPGGGRGGWWWWWWCGVFGGGSAPGEAGDPLARAAPWGLHGGLARVAERLAGRTDQPRVERQTVAGRG